ncbi:MAG: hypothetical protein JWQ92_1146, partial [Amnibacterium sp.]|nr:hypothetical protein [Amnibacterium sp.]
MTDAHGIPTADGNIDRTGPA